MSERVDVAEFPGLKRCESPLGHRWWAYGTNNDDEYPLGDYVPAAWLSDAQRERDEARAALTELIEAAKRANGDHCAPHDCYAIGPMTGNPIADLVACPGCALAAVLARVSPP